VIPALGATSSPAGTAFAVRAPRAAAVWLCLFDGEEERRLAMTRQGECWGAEVSDAGPGCRYGYRADGEWAPERGRWFDSAKLLVDPYAVELDRRFVQDPGLAISGIAAAEIVPRAVSHPALPDCVRRPPRFTRGGLIYELNVRGFTMLHPEVPEAIRGTVAALAHPAVIAHLTKLHVTAVELMPIVAWIDERHLPSLGLRNAWGYNPIAPMALDPGLCPGGITELRDTVASLHEAGIGVILDLVLNHTGESDIAGGVLSLRGLDNSAYAHEPDGGLINDTGCGNTLNFADSAVRDLALATLRHFVRHCGVDGFRFDLATIMARGPAFDAQAPIFAEIAADPWLADRVMIAEPWDVGPGGYQLGNFPPPSLQWNDPFRAAGRSVNFLAAHDGFTLADTVAYETRHNLANGENNRDGHAENFSWNNGVEGPSDDPLVTARRDADLRALLGTLFASVGTIMLTAGDEFGRSQGGNNNAYAQDNRISWVDWQARDEDLEAFVAALSRCRAGYPRPLTALPSPCEWLGLDGKPMTTDAREAPTTQGFEMRSLDERQPGSVKIDRSTRSATFVAGNAPCPIAAGRPGPT